MDKKNIIIVIFLGLFIGLIIYSIIINIDGHEVINMISPKPLSLSQRGL